MVAEEVVFPEPEGPVLNTTSPFSQSLAGRPTFPLNSPIQINIYTDAKLETTMNDMFIEYDAVRRKA